jgi:hypothetical protein
MQEEFGPEQISKPGLDVHKIIFNDAINAEAKV